MIQQLRQQTDSSTNTMSKEYVNVYGLAGLPGAGKSTMALILAGETDSALLRAGKAIRQMAERDGISSPSSHELGQYAAERRRESGPGFMGDYFAEQIGTMDPGQGLVIDSFRHVEGIRKVHDLLEVNFTAIWVECPRPIRLHRIQRRSRDDEGDFTEEDLVERDAREMEDLGVRTLLDYDFDVEVRNEYGKRHLRDRVMEIINE